ncbi:ada2a-containing complex component 1 isoform X2 [Tachypleus tridentatus]|uniref:ada2a-containing complex component 1 isoform X2 n=1 Tax=Tachypleus tridentatus TaxID=6853 RepID=UPI003FD54562
MSDVTSEVYNNTEKSDENDTDRLVNQGDALTDPATKALKKSLAETQGDQSKENESYDDIGEFFFESDHLALKGNSDYHNMLKTIVMLEAQKVQAIQDIEKLMALREQAVKTPIQLVEKLQRRECLQIPERQRVVQLPQIDWDQYALSDEHLSFGKKQLTRQMLKGLGETVSNNSMGDGSEIEMYETVKTSEGNSQSVLVRGRPFNQSKPSTFNQLWTPDEQKRLEDLLIQFPPEEVEARRWKKIAAALGNRTPIQVASRVQKYFIKLAKAGLPVPGRLPNVNSLRKTSSRRNQFSRQQARLMFKSSFFASHAPPVLMNDHDDDQNSMHTFSVPSSVDGDATSEVNDDSSDEEGISPELKDTPEYKELMLLKRLKNERLKCQGLAQHVGFKCDRCKCEPIVGTRWHCTDCPSEDAINLCSDCVDCIHETDVHKSDHHLESFQHSQTSATLDKDYMYFMGGNYNYLDPNYMPAT